MNILVGVLSVGMVIMAFMCGTIMGYIAGREDERRERDV